LEAWPFKRRWRLFLGHLLGICIRISLFLSETPLHTVLAQQRLAAPQQLRNNTSEVWPPRAPRCPSSRPSAAGQRDVPSLQYFTGPGGTSKPGGNTRRKSQLQPGRAGAAEVPRRAVQLNPAPRRGGWRRARCPALTAINTSYSIALPHFSWAARLSQQQRKGFCFTSYTATTLCVYVILNKRQGPCKHSGWKKDKFWQIKLPPHHPGREN